MFVVPTPSPTFRTEEDVAHERKMRDRMVVFPTPKNEPNLASSFIFPKVDYGQIAEKKNSYEVGVFGLFS